MAVFRCYTEKKEGFTIEANTVFSELRDYLGIKSIESVRILNRYDVEGIKQEIYEKARYTVFAQEQIDILYDEFPPDFGENSRVLFIEALPGQYDQRAESCRQCLELLSVTMGKKAPTDLASPLVYTAKGYIIYGHLTDDEMKKIRGYLINSVESRSAGMKKPETLQIDYPPPKPAYFIDGFINNDNASLMNILGDYSLAMDMSDLLMLQEYFRDTEKRDPTVTELRVLDTYWSDHCRHTTFFTHLNDIVIEDPYVMAAYNSYLKARDELYGADAEERPQTLMDIATIAAKTLRSRGLLSNIELSDEVNACSIHIDAQIDGKSEDWLLMFKNETHNHPTEVEPFGGAATCVGGAIRDPLSGRAYVYQAMRVTGAGDPLADIQKTIPNKMPQRKLTITAAQGNSSYGNHVGLSAGLVHEIYHPGYAAKRMELGAVVGAVKAENVIREKPLPGDKIILLGGRTGRDGIGGATGSSRSQTVETLVTIAAEVQKGDAVEERKIQRLFLDPEVTKMIKKCNDFGAGGVSVAVGELADGLDINLSLVRTKYEGLDGTEIAISESQERMAVVIASENVDAFIEKARGENLDAYVIAEVTNTNRMVMHFNGQVIVDISRDFLATNGATKYAKIHVPVLDGADAAKEKDSTASYPAPPLTTDTKPAQALKDLVHDLRFCSQRGLIEMFDGTIGSNNVLMKLGGKTQSTPAQVMAATLPVAYDSETSTCSVMAYGFDPILSSENPYKGAKTAVITSVAKLVAAGCDHGKAYLSFQEYFERLRDEPIRWGKPFSALLGAFEAQMGLGLGAIGGKDSMSGSFGEIDVPPTLVSFAIAPNEAEYMITPEFKQPDSKVVVFEIEDDLAKVSKTWKTIRKHIADKKIVSAWAISDGCVVEGIFKMSLGNEIGFEFDSKFDAQKAFMLSPGSIIAEVTGSIPDAVTIGSTIKTPEIKLFGESVSIAQLKRQWEKTLQSVFPTDSSAKNVPVELPKITYEKSTPLLAHTGFAKPRAVVIGFPGTTGEIDAARALASAGAAVSTVIVKNMTASMLEQSMAQTAKAIADSQILVLPGGSTLADEPDGSAKFINLLLREKRIENAIFEHINSQDGLILGICNGFQALIKLGLLPYGEIKELPADSPTLSKNLIGRHQAKYVFTRVSSTNSPWMNMCKVGDVHTIAVSHGEGRFNASDEMIAKLINNGQIATQYTSIDGLPSMEISVNPNGSRMAIEGLFSPDGRVFGKMGHTERHARHTAKNIYGNKHQPIFESGVNYYK